MTNSHNATTTTCFSSVLRRFTCAGGLPTHPSSDTDDSKDQQNTDDSLLKLRPPSPTTTTTTTNPAGLVARLMGLDSFPNSPNPNKVSLGSIMQKSRSVSYVDLLPNLDITKPPHHRRVTTSLSFREVNSKPTFLHDIGKPELPELPEIGLTPIPEKSKGKKKNMVKKSQSQSQRVNGHGKEEKKKYKARRRTYNHSLPKMEKHHNKKKKKLMLKKRDSEYSEEFCIKVLVEVFRLTMMEIESGVWVDKKVVYNMQDISYEISKEILHVLVNELVDELCI